MAKVIGFDEKVLKRFTCSDCGAIVEYAPNDVIPLLFPNGTPVTDEGTRIQGLTCPNCGEFHRTNH